MELHNFILLPPSPLFIYIYSIKNSKMESDWGSFQCVSWKRKNLRNIFTPNLTIFQPIAQIRASEKNCLSWILSSFMIISNHSTIKDHATPLHLGVIYTAKVKETDVIEGQKTKNGSLKHAMSQIRRKRFLIGAWRPLLWMKVSVWCLTPHCWLISSHNGGWGGCSLGDVIRSKSRVPSVGCYPYACKPERDYLSFQHHRDTAIRCQKTAIPSTGPGWSFGFLTSKLWENNVSCP